MRCAGKTDDVRVLGLDLRFLVESISLLFKNGSFFLSFGLSFCKSNDIHNKKSTMAINTNAASMQKSNK